MAHEKTQANLIDITLRRLVFDHKRFEKARATIDLEKQANLLFEMRNACKVLSIYCDQETTNVLDRRFELVSMKQT